MFQSRFGQDRRSDESLDANDSDRKYVIGIFHKITKHKFYELKSVSLILFIFLATTSLHFYNQSEINVEDNTKWMRLSQQDQRNRLYIHNFFTIIVEWRKSFRFLDTIYLRGSIGPMMSRSVERKMRYSLSPPLLCLAPTPALVNIKDKSR